MTPLELVAKIAEIALRLGPEVARAWEAIYQSLRAEVPELDRSELPKTDERVDAARAAGIRNQEAARAEALKRAVALGDVDDDGTELP